MSEVDDDSDFHEIFKYRSLRGQYGRDFVEDVIVHSRMYWADPLSFNDPFDCSPFLYFGNTSRERERFVKRIVPIHMPNASRLQRRQKVKEILSRPIAEQQRIMRDGYLNFMSETAVCCFSEVNDSLLMWAHYADSHRGVCFIFRETKQPFWLSFRVRYSPDRPRVNIAEELKPEFYCDLLLSKSEEWAYERERRMIDYRQAAGVRSFPPHALQGVILGARISDDDRLYVNRLLLQRGGMRVYQAHVEEQHFGLRFERIR